MSDFSKINLDILILWLESIIIVLGLFSVILFCMLKIVKQSIPSELYEIKEIISKLKEKYGTQTERDEETR